MINPNLVLQMKRAGGQVLLLDQIEKGKTSFLSGFWFSFYCWLQSNIDLTADWAAAPASSLMRAVVRFERSSANSVISAPSVSEEARLLM